MTPSVANHAYVRVKTFLTWCRRRKLIPSNPLEDMKMPYKMQSRDRILTDDELRRIWHACLQLGTFGRIVQMLILTGCRRSEIADLRGSGYRATCSSFRKSTRRESASTSSPYQVSPTRLRHPFQHNHRSFFRREKNRRRHSMAGARAKESSTN